MEKKQGKVSFSINPTQRRRLIKPTPACLAAAVAVADEGTRSRSPPARQFITEFGPSQTATPAAPAPPAIVIAPLPNSHLFRRDGSSSSLKPAAAVIEGAAGIVFTTEPVAVDNPAGSSSSHVAYGLNLPPSATADKKESNKAPPSPHQVTVNTSSSELLRRRFKQEMAALSDHGDTAEECPKFSAKAFAAAVLAGYGWSEGQGIGRNNKKKGDIKVFSGGRRPGTGAQRQTFGLGYNPERETVSSGAGNGKKRKRQGETREQERVCSVRPRTRS